MNNTKLIKIFTPEVMTIAINALSSGCVIAFPTDTVYGIGCLVNNHSAISRLYEIKNRPEEKAIPVLIGNSSQLEEVVSSISDKSRLLFEAFWPGALTIVFFKSGNLPESLSQYKTIGIRMPDHLWLRELMSQVGPLAVTSANISGLESAKTSNEVLNQLNGKIDMVIDGGLCQGGVPSTVVDCTKDRIRILREGAISRSQILKVMGETEL